MPTLYVSDLDGTLLNDSAELTRESSGILNELIEGGIGFTIATARSPISAVPKIARLRLKLPFVAMNGAFICSPEGDRLSEMTFTASQRDTLARKLVECGLEALVFGFDGAAEHVLYREDRLTPGILSYLDSRKGDPRLKAAEAGMLYAGDVFCLTSSGAYEELKPFFDDVSKDESYNCMLYKDHYSERFWCETLPRAATKANGVRRLADMCGFDRIVCFGDELNDISMLEAADFSCAMSNAHGSVKRAASAVICSNADGGVARWLARHARSEYIF